VVDALSTALEPPMLRHLSVGQRFSATISATREKRTFVGVLLKNTIVLKYNERPRGQDSLENMDALIGENMDVLIVGTSHGIQEPMHTTIVSDVPRQRCKILHATSSIHKYFLLVLK
jgi:hypothetical protein